MFFCFLFKQKTAYDMRISDWSSDVCSSDLALWRNVRHQQESSENTLKRALLQSMPGHSGYDPGTARRRLSAISYSKNTEDAALARIRLTEISNGRSEERRVGKE